MKIEKGFLATFEACEGAGKTTQSRKLEEKLNKDGFSVLHLREPGSSKFAEAVRRVLLDPDVEWGKTDPSLPEFLLYSSARAHLHEYKVRPWLNEGNIVLLDRCIDSSDAYQGYGRGLDLTKMRMVHRWVLKDRFPDLTFFIDLEPEEGFKRLTTKEFGKKDRLEQEQIEFHNKVYEGYKSIAARNPERVRIIPYIPGGIDEMHNIIVNHFYTAYFSKMAKYYRGLTK